MRSYVILLFIVAYSLTTFGQDEADNVPSRFSIAFDGALTNAYGNMKFDQRVGWGCTECSFEEWGGAISWELNINPRYRVLPRFEVGLMLGLSEKRIKAIYEYRFNTWIPEDPFTYSTADHDYYLRHSRIGGNLSYKILERSDLRIYAFAEAVFDPISKQDITVTIEGREPFPKGDKPSGKGDGYSTLVGLNLAVPLTSRWSLVTTPYFGEQKIRYFSYHGFGGRRPHVYSFLIGGLRFGARFTP